MFTFALAFLQAIDRYFSLHFQPFQLFVESGRRNLEESIHNENYWPQPLHVPGAECQIDRFAAYFSSFPKKIHFKILKKNLSKPENRIPWLFTDFDSIKDFRWLFPDLKQFSFLPDFSLTVATYRHFRPSAGKPPPRLASRPILARFLFQCPTYSMIRNKFYYKVKTLIPNITQLPINGLINEPMNYSNYFINIQFIFQLVLMFVTNYYQSNVIAPWCNFDS